MHSFSKSEPPGIDPHVSERIRARLDAFVNGEYDSDVLAAELVAVCEEYPHASWEVLALLDQYHRRGHLTAEIYQAVKAETDKLIFGSPAGDATLELGRTSDSLRPALRPQVPAEAVREKPASDDSTAVGAPRRTPRIEDQPPRAMAPRLLTPGTVLRDRYVLEEPLGRGGMSTLFKALDRHRLGLPDAERYVAIKFLRDEYTMRPEAIVALQDEFYQAQLLSHPNIIKVFDLDHDGDLHFITMELLEGEPLSQWIGRMHPRLLPIPQALAIIREVGDALAYAHERGVVHADLKPANIMITAAGRIRVLDFGLSSRLASDPLMADPARPLRLHAATPAYASPERHAGQAPDPRDDIFSLACIAYELFSGKRPFGEPRGNQPYPRKRRPRRIRSLTGRQWRTLRQGLARTRERRPSTVRDWLGGLELHQAVEDLLPRPALRAGSRRRLWPSAASGMVLITAVTAFLVIAEIGPFRDLPWAVTVREFAQEAFAPVADRIFGAVRSIPVEAPPSAPDVAPAPPAAADGASREEQSAAPREGATVMQSVPVPTAASVASPAQQPSQETEVAASPAQQPSQETESAAGKAPSAVVRGPGVLSFTQESYAIGESDTVARLTVQRMAGSDGEVSFRWRTEAASATVDEDFGSFEDATERLAAGQQTTVLYIPIVSDAVREYTELFHVEIDDPQGGASLGPTTRATVIIVDDD